jgi:uncharacterized protein (DUF302 family)
MLGVSLAAERNRVRWPFLCVHTMHVRYRIERRTIVLCALASTHPPSEDRAFPRRSDLEDHSMLTRAKFLRLSGVAAAAMAVTTTAQAKSDDGVVRVKSAYGFAETIERLKKDIAAKGIMFFSEIDQSKLAAGAGIRLNPSTLLVFGNPPLGTQFMTSNPNAGLDWPVRLLVIQDSAGAVWTVYTDFAWIAARHGIVNRGDQFKMASMVIASITSSVKA